jgi:branched-chain amino acid transport system ATP-binding protein
MVAETDASGSGGHLARGTRVLLEARGVAFGYGKVPVVEDVDLRVAEGQVIVLLGANGAGKTTVLRGLAGELRPARGEVHWLGDRARSPLHVRCREGLAYVSEERSVFSRLSVLDNLRLGRGRVETALDLAPELRPLLRRRAGLLSGGEQQILTLARALAAQPKVLLADELSLGLAPQVAERLLEAARVSARERNVGVVIVEQHLRVALHYADYGYVIQRGRLVMSGSAAELSARVEEIEASYLTQAGA